MIKIIISKFSTKAFTATLALFFSFTSVYGQQVKVKGTVTGDGSLLPGVSVTVKGEQVGSVTDFDGNFEISANKDDVLDQKCSPCSINCNGCKGVGDNCKNCHNRDSMKRNSKVEETYPDVRGAKENIPFQFLKDYG